ncbi:MAG: hypothetical protein ABR517_03110 [Thermoanaerobaculia bacterium]
MNEVPFFNFVFLALSVGMLIAALVMVLRPEEARAGKKWQAWLLALGPIALAVQFALSAVSSMPQRGSLYAVLVLLITANWWASGLLILVAMFRRRTS